MNSNLDVETIRNALNTADQSERRHILKGLFPLEDPEVMVLIASYLSDPFPSVSEAAVEALARCENSTAAEAAAIHLRSSEPSERGYALEALIRLGSHALPILIGLLEDPDQNVRKFAVDALASIHAPESLPTLLEALVGSDTIVASAAAEGLGMFGNSEVVPFLGAAVERGPDWLRISALASLGKIGGEEAQVCICRISSDSPVYVQAAAVNAISSVTECGSTAAYAFLTSLLCPERPALEEEIVKTLGRWIANEKLSATNLADLNHIGIPFKPAIDTALNSQDPQVRAAAATCFRAIEDFEKTTILRMFSDKEIVVRTAALNTLACRSAISFEELAHIAMDEQEDNDIRITALHCLANIVHLNVPLNDLIVDGLNWLLNTAHEPSIRAAALRVFLLSGAYEGNAAVFALLAEEEFTNNDAVLAELRLCPIDLVLTIAQKCLDENDADVRWLSFTTLVSLEQELEWAQHLNGRALIITALSDDDWRIRVHAVSILEKWVDQEWARKLLHIACESLDDHVRVRAVHVLGSIEGSQEELDILRAHLSDSSERVRTAAFRALAGLMHVEEDMMRRALLDPYPPMQKAALVALLSSVPNSNSQPLWALAEEIVSQSTDIEISELGTEFKKRSAQC